MKKIENKIGVFHKGDQTSKYNRYEDGISIGEVGFPTLLHHADFKFTCMYRNDYFVNEWALEVINFLHFQPRFIV